jgi:hypothetical protein
MGKDYSSERELAYIDKKARSSWHESPKRPEGRTDSFLTSIQNHVADHEALTFPGEYGEN